MPLSLKIRIGVLITCMVAVIVTGMASEYDLMHIGPDGHAPILTWLKSL